MSRKFSQPIIVVMVVILFSIGCSLITGTAQSSKTGTIQIVNDHVRGSDPFPGGKNLPDAREYGVCIIVYQPTNPAGLVKPTFDMILAKDGETTNYQLPAGTYTLQEWQFDSEINQDPLYSPAMKTYVRLPENVSLKADQTITFGSERSLSAPSDFVEGNPLNPNCAGAAQGPGVFPTDTPEAATDTPEADTETPTDTPEAVTGAWVLKLVQPDVGKNEVQFSFPGLACSGGTVISSGDTSATSATTGTCQVNGALVANATTQHTWSRPPDQLTPGEEVAGSMTASEAGLCSWQDSVTEEACRRATTTSHIVWQGDGWPGGPVEFPYQNLVYGNDYAGTARAFDNPTGSYTWTAPDGSMGGGKTLVLQFVSAASGGKVYTNFWYEWVAP